MVILVQGIRKPRLGIFCYNFICLLIVGDMDGKVGGTKSVSYNNLLHEGLYVGPSPIIINYGAQSR